MHTEGGIVPLRSLADGFLPLDVVPTTVATLDSARIWLHAMSSMVEDHLV